MSASILSYAPPASILPPFLLPSTYTGTLIPHNSDTGEWLTGGIFLVGLGIPDLHDVVLVAIRAYEQDAGFEKIYFTDDVVARRHRRSSALSTFQREYHDASCYLPTGSRCRIFGDIIINFNQLIKSDVR